MPTFVSVTQPPSTIATLPLDNSHFANWTGLKPVKTKLKSPFFGAATLQFPGEAFYQVPTGPKGWYDKGLMREHDGTLDLRDWFGLNFEIYLENDKPFEGKITLAIPPQPDRHDLPDTTRATYAVQGKGWHTVTVPIESFDNNRGQIYLLKFIQKISFSSTAQAGQIQLRSVRLTRGNGLRLESTVRSQPADAGETANYPVTVTNTSDKAQIIALSIRKSGWEEMAASVAPPELSLPPGQSGVATLSVKMTSRVPGGGHEDQILEARSGDGSLSHSLQFTTLRRLSYPFLLHDKAGWDEVRANSEKYDWAKQSRANIIRQADAFVVPEVPPGGIGSDQGTNAVYKSYIEQKFWPVVLAYQLTGDKKYAQTLALLLVRFSDPRNGYPTTLHAVSQGIPQEGGFFEGLARAYDSIHDAGVLSDAAKAQIEQTFRLFIGTVEDRMGDGGISNWSTFNLSPAAQCALVIQDLSHFDYLMNGPCGLVDHLRYGTMDDGWWYEMSLSYNLGCAEVYTNLALAAKPFGIDLLNQKFPVAATSKVGLRPWEYENLLGMAFGKYGPVKDNWVSIKKMWDAIIKYPDYRSVMFGMGDGHEERVGGRGMEIAYYIWRDPNYAAILKQSRDRDLVFAVSELPADTPLLYTQSAYSDNAGIAVLRSQTAGREPREQIQASFKYGTHGSYHGHFDRLAFNSLERYGISFWNPETSWFGYGGYMYKMWVQTSLPHNMVVVDGKMQEPAESKPLLFHSGRMMQVSAAENVARWSNPPYLGGNDQIHGIKDGSKPFVPIPDNAPQVGELTDYTEPITTRRAVIVTDDYVVLADWLRGEEDHQFDNLLHLRGARVAGNATPTGHNAQFDTSPLSSGQFITNVTTYDATAPALIESVHRIPGELPDGTDYKVENAETGGAGSLSEPGDLHIDEYAVWPPKSQLLVGNYAECWWGTNKNLTWSVQGDDKTLAQGKVGVWILGTGQIDADVTGLKSLTLSTQTPQANNYQRNLMWAYARLVTADGKEIPLSSLPIKTQNVVHLPENGRDFYGGPITIGGTSYTDALSAEPQNFSQPAQITVDLAGLNAVKLKATVGGDFALGNEEQFRKVVSIRSRGREARFLTVIEPYQKQKMVKSAVATSPDSLRVELNDGRVQTLTLKNLDGDARHLEVSISENRNGQPTRSETATSGQP